MFIAGSTHPSFSDVFLILPDYLNRLTGLRIDADKVIDMSIHVVERFLLDRVQEITNKAERAASLISNNGVGSVGDGGDAVDGVKGCVGVEGTGTTGMDGIERRRPSLLRALSMDRSSRSGGSSKSFRGSLSMSRGGSGSGSGNSSGGGEWTARDGMDVVEVTSEAHLRRVKESVREGKSIKGRGVGSRRKSGLGDVGGMVLFRTTTASRL